MIDPLGCTTNFTYSNQIDLAAISQVTVNGFQTTIAQFTYNYQHRPIAYTDAALQTTDFAYNAFGQLTSVTNPLGQTSMYTYDAAHNLGTIVNANNVTAASFTYDPIFAARVRIFTDSEGWTVTYDYDAADRVTKVTYPDGTFEAYTYDKLDLASYRDRQFRVWTYSHDANRRLTATTDPAGQQTLFGYDRDGRSWKPVS